MLADNVTTHGFLWKHGRWTDLGTVGADYNYSYAQWINDRGQIAGGSCTPTWSCRGFLWDDGRMIGLGLLPGGMEWSWAQAVNDRGQVAGAALTPAGTQHAVLWTVREHDRR
jgi:probable HAF family extracellular repeat protein